MNEDASVHIGSFRDIKDSTITVAGRDVIQLIVGGLGALPTDYAGRITNFLVEYLGTAEEPVPFGGRADQLDALHQWLADPSAPPYALIAAPAGRGKSALLARWARQVTMQAAAHIAFVPVSIRFNTSMAGVVFTALAARLGEIYGEPVKWADLNAEQWRGVCMSYLQRTPPEGRQVVVVLDGLDEAGDWKAGSGLVPLAPPPGVRVLVSARYLANDVDEKGWLRRLEWSVPGRALSIPLPALTRSGVSDVLLAMGNPLDRLATRVDVIGELFRLSEGDPLLVRLYVDALLPYGARAAALSPDDLPSVREGLDGYFERWWDEQQTQWQAQGRNPLTEKADLLDFFNLCATALGPLARDDVDALTGGQLGSGLRLKVLSGEVERFVIGDGRARGYVFSHPRLAQFFTDQMTTAEHVRWESRFLDYGRTTLQKLSAGTLKPELAPAYAVQHYGVHLERALRWEEGGASWPAGSAPAPADLYALIGEGWLRASEALEGTYSGFLEDVERVWRRAEAEKAIDVQVQCALCRASIATLSANITPALLHTAVEYQLRTPLQALVIARQMPVRARRADALVLLAPLLPDALLEQAVAAALAIDHGDLRARALAGIMPRLAPTLQADVLSGVRVIAGEDERVAALAAIAEHLDAGLLPEAVALARALRRGSARARAAVALAPYAPEALMPDVLALVLSVENSAERVAALGELVPRLPPALLADLLAALALIPEEDRRAAALASLAAYLPESLQPQALAGVRAFSSEWARVEALGSLAGYLHEPQLRPALDVLPSIANEELRVRALQVLLPAQRFGGIYGAAPWPFVLSQPGYYGMNAHHPRESWPADDALNDALLQIVAGLQDEVQRARAIDLLAGSVPAISRERLFALAMGISSIPHRLQCAAQFLAYLDERVLDQALADARSLDDDETRVQLLRLMAVALVDHWPRQARVLLVLLRDRRQSAALWEFAQMAVSLPRDLQLAAQPVLAQAVAMYQQGVTEQDAARWTAQLAALVAGYHGEPAAQQPPDLYADDEPAEPAPERAFPALDRERRLYAPPSPATPDESEMRRVREMDPDQRKLNALVNLAPGLNEALLQQAVEIARAFPDAHLRIGALTGLVSNVAAPLREDLARDVLPDARVLEEPRARGRALSALAPWLPEGLRAEVAGEALAAARAIGDGSIITQSLIDLARAAPEGVTPADLGRLASAALLFSNEWLRLKALTALAGCPALPGGQALLAEAARLAAALPADEARFSLLSRLLPSLPPSLYAEEVALALNAGAPGAALELLAPVLPSLPAALRDEALAALLDACWQLDDDARPPALAALAPFLPAALLQRAADRLDALSGVLARIHVVAAVLPHVDAHLAAPLRARVPGLLVESQNVMTGARVAAEMFTLLLPHVADAERPALRDRALAAVRDTRSRPARALALARLAPLLDEPARAQAWTDALETAGQIAEDDLRFDTLLALLPLLPAAGEAPVLQDLLALARQVPSAEAVVDRMLLLAPYAGEEAQREILAQIRGLKGERLRSKALVALAPYLPAGLAPEALSWAQALGDDRARALALSSLAPYLPAWSARDPGAAYAGWMEALRTLSRASRPGFLRGFVALAPFALALARPAERAATATRIFGAVQDVARWWP